MSQTTVGDFYQNLAEWWPLMSAPEEYVEEAVFYQGLLERSGSLPARTLLELGSGGGNNASHLRKRFDMVLVEPSAGMLAVSERLNPGCEHVRGDMRDIRLGRQFDRVFIHDAIVYMTTEQDLRRAIDTAFAHCRPGGGALFAPDYVRETFRPGTESGGHDGGSRALRFLEWVYDPDPDDTSYVAEYAFVLRDGERSWVEHDRHVEGLFPRQTWLAVIQDAGFVKARALPLEHSEVEPGLHEVFVCERPGD